VYEVTGTLHQQTKTTTNGACIKAFAVLVFSLTLSLFAMSVRRLLNDHAAFPWRSWNATLNGRLEAAGFSPVPNFYPRAALFALPAQSDSNGEIRGRVTFEGTLPKFRPLNMVNEPTCAKHYSAPVLPENVVAGAGNSLQNVVVYISAGVQEEPHATTQPAVLKQWGCKYIPHVLAVETNQEIWVQNEDSVAHTVHPLARINTELNRSQPPGTPPMVIRYDKPEVIRVKCELHSWMRGIFVVLNNSHHSVSDESGSFSLPDLPRGKYTVKAWHEQFGEQSQVVSIGDGEKKELNFTFKVTP
jgi:Carboxypeptidase regulatory-like domain